MEMMFSHHNSNQNELFFVFKNRKTRHGKGGRVNFDFGAGLRVPPRVPRGKSIPCSFMTRDPCPLPLGPNCPTDTNLPQSQFQRVGVAAWLDTEALFAQNVSHL